MRAALAKAMTCGGAAALLLGAVAPALGCTRAVYVGAGDTVVGALAAALAAGRPLREALTRAQAAAALAVTRLGTQSAMPTAAEVDALVADLHLQGDTP